MGDATGGGTRLRTDAPEGFDAMAPCAFRARDAGRGDPDLDVGCLTGARILPTRPRKTTSPRETEGPDAGGEGMPGGWTGRSVAAGSAGRRRPGAGGPAPGPRGDRELAILEALEARVFRLRWSRRRHGCIRLCRSRGAAASRPFGGALLLAALLCAAASSGLGCRTRVPEPSPPLAGELVLFDPAAALLERWDHIELEGATEWRLVARGEAVAIRARADGTASGLIRRVVFEATECPRAEWSWRVDALPESADLRERSGDDVGAALFVFFGDPVGGDALLPRPVPVLRYAWTGPRHAPGEVIESPYLPGYVRTVVLRAGSAELGHWVTEQRNLVQDYRMAFGRPPENPVEGIALFSDSDQTGEATEAYFGSGRVRCEGP